MKIVWNHVTFFSGTGPQCYSFITANFRQEIRMSLEQSVQHFTSNSSYCFHINFFSIGTCVRIPVQTCLIRLKLIALSNVALFSLVSGPLPISACAQIRLTSKLFRYTKQFRWYSLERWHRLMWLWQGALLSLSRSYFITTEAWLPPLNSLYQENKTKRHNNVNSILSANTG